VGAAVVLTGSGRERRLTWLIGGLGVVAAATAIATHPDAARSAAGQTWSPFVLVIGLLLIGFRG
jgi:hypothetical protein